MLTLSAMHASTTNDSVFLSALSSTTCPCLYFQLLRCFLYNKANPNDYDRPRVQSLAELTFHLIMATNSL